MKVSLKKAQYKGFGFECIKYKTGFFWKYYKVPEDKHKHKDIFPTNIANEKIFFDLALDKQTQFESALLSCFTQVHDIEKITVKLKKEKIYKPKITLEGIKNLLNFEGIKSSGIYNPQPGVQCRRFEFDNNGTTYEIIECLPVYCMINNNTAIWFDNIKIECLAPAYHKISNFYSKKNLVCQINLNKKEDVCQQQ